jgi:hypothetical protein
MFQRLALTGLLLTTLAAVVAGCASESADDESSEDAIKKPANDTTPPWVYEGPMPKLDDVHITTSIIGHTTRVTGLLPVGFDASTLPFYAVAQPADGGRTKVSVVYPVATGDKKNGQWNNVPGRYNHLNVRPYRPKDAALSGKENWGGFPFLNYHDERRFAFHGPIDYSDAEDVDNDGKKDEDWRLTRGRISHGCQRMQGEHVLELTHMLGFDMRHPHSTSENAPDPKNQVEGKYVPIDLTVLAEPAYDKFPNPAHGGAMEIVDVAYPKHETVAPLPASQPVMTFKTWDANEMRAWACAVKPADNPNIVKTVPRTGGRFDGTYCAKTNGQNARDAKTGAAIR